jgi:hypothetical protein
MVLRLLMLVVQFVQALLRDPAEVALENVAMRQQLSTFVSKGLRPRVEPADRLFWVCLSRVWSRWTEVVAFVKPETVVRWHREGFGKFWRWRSRCPGRPPIEARIASMVRKMAMENPTWGAPRIHGELLKLGIDVSERTVSR